MKTSSLLVAAFTLVAGYSVYQSQQKEQLSDIALENVEALAGGEGGRGCTIDRNCICETAHADYIEYRNN